LGCWCVAEAAFAITKCRVLVPHNTIHEQQIRCGANDEHILRKSKAMRGMGGVLGGDKRRTTRNTLYFLCVLRRG
jgi:hypothetical protein